MVSILDFLNSYSNTRKKISKWITLNSVFTVATIFYYYCLEEKGFTFPILKHSLPTRADNLTQVATDTSLLLETRNYVANAKCNYRAAWLQNFGIL